MTSGGAGGKFKVEEGIEEAAVAHNALSIFRRHLEETRLSAHDFSNVVRDGFRDADAVKLANVSMRGLNKRVGV